MSSGAINSMNATIRQNRNLLHSLKARKSAFKNRSLSILNRHAEYDFPNSKPWVNRAIKDKLQRDYKSAAIRLWGLMALFVIVFIYFITLAIL